MTPSEPTDLCTIIGVDAGLRLTKARGKRLMVSWSISDGTYEKKEIENFSEQGPTTKGSGLLCKKEVEQYQSATRSYEQTNQSQ